MIFQMAHGPTIEQMFLAADQEDLRQAVTLSLTRGAQFVPDAMEVAPAPLARNVLNVLRQYSNIFVDIISNRSLVCVCPSVGHQVIE